MKNNNEEKIMTGHQRAISDRQSIILYIQGSIILLHVGVLLTNLNVLQHGIL